jgi:hypothetical protein
MLIFMKTNGNIVAKNKIRNTFVLGWISLRLIKSVFNFKLLLTILPMISI